MRKAIAALAITVLVIFLINIKNVTKTHTLTLTSTDPHYTGYELKLIADQINPHGKNVLNWDRKTGLTEGIIVPAAGNLNDYFIPHAVNATINNKPLQIMVKTPKGTSYEETAHVCQELGKYLQVLPGVKSYQIYIDSNKTEIYINGNVTAKRLRTDLKNIADKYNARIKFSGSSHITAEIHGSDPNRRITIAREVKNVFNSTNGVVDVDWNTDSVLPCITANLENPIFTIIQLKAHLPKPEKGYSINIATGKSSCGVSVEGAGNPLLKSL